ncbi:MAG: winged helix-turn-helix domain-containing protein [Spirochaetia bacterium]
MKTKKRSDARFVVQLIGLDNVTFERVRASLRGGPFHFTTAGPGDASEPDLRVAPVRELDACAGGSTPVIACGNASLLRSAFLGGCADFLREPWTPEELELRALAVLSRAGRGFQFSWGTVSFEGKDLRVPAGIISLTHHESRILRLLLRARGDAVPRDAIACKLWGSPMARGRTVDVHIASLRKKVRTVQEEAGRFIVSVRGTGYMIP